MKRTARRFFTASLVLILLLGFLPVSVHAADYNMYITNVRVCDDNRDDILGDGVFSFDGDRTLTVRGNCQTEDLPIIASAIPGLLIRVSADSVLHSNEAPAIVANADLSIVGPGSLDLGSVDSCGIYLYGCGGEIRNITLHASGTWGIAGDKPDDEKEYLRIYNADVSASGAEGAVCDFGGGIVLDVCSLVMPEGGRIGTSAIENAEQKAATEVSILHSGADIPSIHAVIFHNARGSNPATQFVNDGASVAAPSDPVAEDYVFTGWYTDSQCRNRFDFDTPIQSDLHLYSGWEMIPTPPAVILDRLLDAISAAEALDTGRYTDDTAAALASALKRARAALTAMEQSSVDNAAETLEAALSALKEKPVLDPSALEQAFLEALDVDTERYTELSVSSLKEALKVALAALHAETQSDIDAAENALREAMAGLVEKPAEQYNPFSDVTEGSFYYSSVLWALSHIPQVTNGVDETHFSPDATCTRAQVVTFLWRAKGCPAASASERTFKDVSDGYYSAAVAWAVEAGVTEGLDSSHFGPEHFCTRAQVVTFLWRAAGCPKPADAGNPFEDIGSSYYAEAVAWAVETGVTKGKDEAHFAPDATCTRAEVVTFLSRAAEE